VPSSGHQPLPGTTAEERSNFGDLKFSLHSACVHVIVIVIIDIIVFVIIITIVMTKCKGPHHNFMTSRLYHFTTFTTLRLLIDLETHFCTVNPVSISITSRESREVVSREVIKS